MTIKERFSKENISAQIIARVEKKFGADHKIKVALFKAVSEYNDEYDNYNPVLILIDADYNEIDHNIRVHDLCPSEEDQWGYEEEEPGNMLSIDDVTVKF